MDLRGSDNAQSLERSIDRALRDARFSSPGVIQSFDPASQLATVIPAIRQIVTIDDVQTRMTIPPIVRVPCTFMHGQSRGFSVTTGAPVAGDEVLLLFCDRSIDNFVNNGGIVDPIESTVPRAHDFSDAVAIIGLTSAARAISGFLSDGVEIRNRDRGSRATVTDSFSELVFGGATVRLDASGIVMTFGGHDITINGAGIEINAPLQVNGDSMRHNDRNVGDDHVHPILGGSSAPGPTGDPNP